MIRRLLARLGAWLTPGPDHDSIYEETDEGNARWLW